MIIEQNNREQLGTAVKKMLLLPFLYIFFQYGKEGVSVRDNVIYKSEV